MTRACAAVTVLLCAGSCGGTVPDTHYYELAAPSTEASARSRQTRALTVEPFSAETAYDGDRIAYKTSPYRLDYYYYQRWSAPPRVLAFEFLRDAYARAGLAVCTPCPEPSAVGALGGRVMAFREVDESPVRWVGEVAVDLWISTPPGERTVWFGSFVEREPLTQRSPEGLAKALSTALGRIAARSLEPASRAASRLGLESNGP